MSNVTVEPMRASLMLTCEASECADTFRNASRPTRSISSSLVGANDVVGRRYRR